MKADTVIYLRTVSAVLDGLQVISVSSLMSNKKRLQSYGKQEGSRLQSAPGLQVISCDNSNLVQVSSLTANKKSSISRPRQSVTTMLALHQDLYLSSGQVILQHLVLPPINVKAENAISVKIQSANGKTNTDTTHYVYVR